LDNDILTVDDFIGANLFGEVLASLPDLSHANIQRASETFYLADVIQDCRSAPTTRCVKLYNEGQPCIGHDGMQSEVTLEFELLKGGEKEYKMKVRSHEYPRFSLRTTYGRLTVVAREENIVGDEDGQAREPGRPGEDEYGYAGNGINDEVETSKTQKQGAAWQWQPQKESYSSHEEKKIDSAAFAPDSFAFGLPGSNNHTHAGTANQVSNLKCFCSPSSEPLGYVLTLCILLISDWTLARTAAFECIHSSAPKDSTR